MFYIALLLRTGEDSCNSERPKYDSLVYYFTYLQFDPTCLLCQNLFLISKVAEKRVAFNPLSGCLSGSMGWSGRLVSAFAARVPTKQ